MLPIAKITAKGQTTIPPTYAPRLQVGPGDLHRLGNRARRQRAGAPAGCRLICEYLKAVEDTLSEWTGPADEEAYRDL
ncbi:MAG: hypothetical protein KatS3mg126_2370 [Lysobacteraceae bacterium]|nr:MAG: hypothetical protein KatS3mg126_2370 [Xanthomonadaceae bacterium]